MPISKKNSDSLSVKKDERSSRFVVDLRNHEDYQTDKSQDKSWDSFCFRFLKEFSKIKREIYSFFNNQKNIKKKFREFLKEKQEIGPFFRKNLTRKEEINNFLVKTTSFFLRIQEGFFKIKNLIRRNKIKKLENIAIFSILKILWNIFSFVIKFIYKIFYKIGWILVFIVRFVYFFFNRILFILDKNFIFTKKIFLFVITVINIGFLFLFYLLAIPLKLIKIIINPFNSLFFALRKKFPQKSNLSFKKNLPSWNFKLPFRRTSLWQRFKQRFAFRLRFFEKIKFPRIKSPRIKIWKPKYFSFSFLLFLLVFSLPFLGLSYYKSLHSTEDKILGVAEAAVGDLQGASDSILNMDFSGASRNFSQASENFLKAEQELSKVNKVLFSLAGLSDNKKAQLASQADNVVAAGKAASNLGADISAALDSLFNYTEKDILEIVDDFIYYGQSALLEANKLDSLLAKIDMEVLPPEYQEQFISLKNQTSYIKEGLKDFLDIAQKLDGFLGANMDKRYLLVFQNNTEMRATGGFIGSFALVDFKNGKMDNLEVPEGGSYDTEGGLKKLIAAPEPLQLVDSRWHFWDANWWPDWPRSAEKLMWFYEKSGGSTVDGVISFTPTVLEKILASIGPIDMQEDYGVTINQDNFWLTVQQIVEKKDMVQDDGTISENKKPKKIIGDLMDEIISELPKRLNRETLVNLFNALEESLREKHVLFYFTDQDLQKEIEERGWGGRIKKTSSNYLSVINTNIAGGKSDKKIKEIINHKTEILPNGEIINTLRIKRTHTGSKSDPFAGVRNVDWMRIYVPWGSKLIEAEGFLAPDEIYFEEADPNWEQDEHILNAKETERMHEESGTLVYDELGKTVFANWSMVDPGESAVVYLKYKLPFTLKNKNEKLIDKIKKIFNPNYNKYYPYSLYIQKQAGAMPSEINTSLSILGDYDIVWRYPENLNITSSGWQTSGSLNRDKYQSILLSK